MFVEKFVIQKLYIVMKAYYLPFRPRKKKYLGGFARVVVLYKRLM